MFRVIPLKVSQWHLWLDTMSCAVSLRSLCVWCWLGSSHFQVNRLWWSRSLSVSIACGSFSARLFAPAFWFYAAVELKFSRKWEVSTLNPMIMNFREQRFSKSDLDNSLLTTEKLTSNKNMKVYPDNISCSVIWFYMCLLFFIYFFPCKKQQQTKQTKITTEKQQLHAVCMLCDLVLCGKRVPTFDCKRSALQPSGGHCIIRSSGWTTDCVVPQFSTLQHFATKEGHCWCLVRMG